MRKLNALLIVCFATVLASTVRAQTGGVNNAELNGNYAFTFTGMTGNGTVSSVFGAVGRFTADGAGNLTNGELDTNAVGGGGAAQSFTGTYSIGADNRGVMTLSIGARFAFAMLANGNAEFIKFDASGGAGTIGSGTMEKADTTAYSTAGITGDYAFGAAGSDNTNNRAAIEGRFTSNGTGALTNAAGDVNGYGTDYPMNFSAANYAVSNTATGRGTMNFTFTFGGTPDSLNFVFYVVNAGKLFVMESDTVTRATPLLNGVVVRQQIPAGGFTNGSLNGNMVISLTGHSACGGPSGVPKAVVGLLTTNGSGALSLTYDENFCSAPNSATGAAGTFSVAANGRASIAIGGYALVAYLMKSNQIFLFVSDVNVLFGVGEPQSAASFTNTSLQGAYAGFATNPVGYGVTVFSGEFSANGASPTGSMTGTEDIGTPSGPNPGVAFNATYSVSPSPSNGRGTMTVTSGTGGNVVIYMISPAKFVAISLSDPNPAVLDFELSSSAPAPVSLSSFTLNPTSVTGGNSSTGTVTLNEAAPAGGVQVALYSSNTTAARVPSSVTVAAGTSSATFPVSTSAVAASTAVTISASYSGATRSASLTVTPAPPPPPTLSSLSMNPTSVTGGNPSTGTVTLSGSAPAGGAQVTLSSSNATAARVPSSVTVAAGATSVTFTVSTSAVAVSTPVTISASYSGATRSASLTVTPQPNYTLSASPSSLTVTQGSGGTSTITITPRNGFGGSVGLSASGLPSGVGASFSPNPATTRSTLTLSASSTASVGRFTVTIKGTSGSLTHTTTLTLTVNALPRYALTVSDTGLGSGTVTSSPAGIDCGSTCSASYVSGTTVTLTATPGLLSGFGGWSGCDAVSGNTCTVNMNSARSVTADFTLLGLL